MSDFDHRETEAHYQTLLAPIYAWMLGDLDTARATAAAELARLGIGAPGSGPKTGANRRALDLGAGIGLHAAALTALGYQVTAIDSSVELLAQLARACPGAITIAGDLVSAAARTAGPFELIVCMGDTLTHLSSPEVVRDALDAAARLLAPDGTLVLTFRDYTRARRGAARFFLVRGDDQRILTCCLDYDETRVAVTDVVHERARAGTDGGAWQMRASTYHKLRLTAVEIAATLDALGLAVARADSEAGWITVVARGAQKPDR
jgi:SAM-dependent methyltransferase